VITTNGTHLKTWCHHLCRKF